MNGFCLIEMRFCLVGEGNSQEWWFCCCVRALTNFISNLAILLPYFLYHRLIFLCPPLISFFHPYSSLLINYGNLLTHVPCIFIWKLCFSILKLYSLTSPNVTEIEFHHFWESLNLDLFDWEKWSEMGFLPLSVVVQNWFKEWESQARKQSLCLMLLEDNDSRLRKMKLTLT